MIDKKQWEDAKERLGTASANDPVTAELKSRAAVLGDKLSADKHWQKFQEEAAKHILQAQSAISAFQTILLDPTTVSADELNRAKIGFHAHQMKLDCFNLMLEFPNKYKSVDD